MSFLTSLMFRYGLVAIFFLILIEYACFPVSSEIVLPFSGAVASHQHINYLLVLAISVVAGLIGTSLCYMIGRIGGAPLLDYLVIKFPKTKAPIENSYNKFEQYGTLAVCIGRVIPICRTYIAFVAGATKQKYSIFLTASCIGITFWNSVLIGLGYIFRENWKIISTYYQDYKQIFIISILILIAIFVHQKVKRTRI